MDPQIPAPPAPTKFPLTSPRGSTRLATRTWVPPPGSANRAIALIVHGAGWHSGYYTEFAKLLTNEGIFVAAYDQPSCGYSQVDREAPAGCTHIYSMDEIVDEVYEAVEWAKKESGAPNLPFFLIGESFGGVQVLSAAFECRERNVELAGIVLLGALIRPAKQALPPNLIVRALVWLSQYYAKFKMPAVDYSKTFDDAFGSKGWAEVARSDPKVNVSPKFTLGAAAAILSSGATLLEQSKLFPVPLFAVHASKDCRTQCEAVQEFVDGVGPVLGSIHIVDSTGHQLLQDEATITKEVIGVVLDWMKRRLVK